MNSNGAASAISGAKVTIAGTRGYYYNSGLSAASDLRQGYIDDNNDNPSPQFVVEGIPYYRYKTVLYFSSDGNATKFGYVTVNGLNYKGDLDNKATVASEGGSEIWGSANTSAFTEGGNYLVIPTQTNTDGKLTVVSHRLSGSRAGLAAVQIVEVKPEVTENDLVISVSGDTTYTVEDTQNLSGTVYITGNGTLTLAGEAKISAATINVGPLVTLVVNADRLDGTTFTGGGTVVYDGSQPDATKGFNNSAWAGTVWVQNVGDTSRGEATDSKVTTCLGSDTADPSSNDLNKWGNANSFVKFTNVRAYMAAANVPWTLILEDDSTNYAWYNNEGWTARTITIAGLKGTGTFWDINDGGCRPFLNFTDASQFSGSIKALGKQVFLNGAGTGNASDLLSGRIVVPADQVLTVSAGETWHTRNGLVVNGTLSVNGTLGSESTSSAVSGSGTVVFGGVPSPAGDKWWKNAAWTGTVEIKGVSALNGDYVFNDYGNSGSTLKLTNCSGWLKPNYTCVPALEIRGVFTWNDGSSGLNNTFKVATLKGSGTISIPNQGASTAVWQITDDWSGFTGPVVGNNSAAQRILVFGSTLPTTVTAGDIYISEGATLDLDNSSGAWWGVGMRFVVDGTVKASARNKWGGGTAMTLGDTGVLELTSTGNINDSTVGTSPTSADFSNVTGTGTIKYSSTAGWRAFPDQDAKMPASTVGIQVELADSLIISKSDGETVIGSLSGLKNIRSDFNSNGAAGRILTVTQSKDTEWQGKFVSNRITKFNVAAPAEGTSGTLTLSGAQEATIPMQIDGAVNLTGTWVGATTVAGTFGGTGTLTGNLTFSDGATLKANASALTVSGTVTLPTGDGESLTIEATGLDADEVTILSSESITTETDVSKVTVDGLYTVEAVAGALKLVSTRVEVTVPAINNATVTVSVGGETIGTEAGTYKVAPDAVVTATYAAAEGYEISGQTVYTIDVSNSETTFDPAGTTEVKQYVAYVVFQQESGQSFIDVTNNYTTVSNAIDAAKAMKKVVVLIAQPEATDTYNISVGETINVKKGEFTFDGIIFPEGSQYINTTTETAGVTKYTCAVYTATVQYPGQEPVGMTGSLIQILGGLYSGYVPAYSGTVVTVLDGSDATVGDAMPEVFTYDSEAHTYTLKTMVASYNNGYTTTYYPTLSNAFENVVAGGTIKVIADNTVAGPAIKFTKNLTLDLNGFTTTRAIEAGHMFEPMDGASFTITDTSEGATGKAVAAQKIVLSGSACTFTLAAGTLQSDGVPVQLWTDSNVSPDSRVVNINGGKLICGNQAKGTDSCIMNDPGIINMTAGVIESSQYGFQGNYVNVSGGTVNVNTSKGVFRLSHDQRVTGGTFNRDVSQFVSSGYEILNNGDGTYTVRRDNGWMYAAPGYWDYTGTWTEGAVLGDDKVTISDGATYSNRTASAGQLVTVTMTLSFDDVNDDEDGYEGAKAAIRLGTGETEGTYVFQLYTYENSAATWKNATGFTPTVNMDYNVLFVLDLTNKTYTASIVSGATTNELSVGGSTAIPFACQGEVTPVQTIDFVGSGTVSSIEGSYEDAPVPEGFVENDEVTLSDGSATLTAAQATWLNQFGAKSTVAARLAELSSAQFTAAYLLNLDITGTFSYTFNVTGFGFETVNETECAVVTVTLTRTGALQENNADKPINGTLKLTGAMQLGGQFETKTTATISDDDFSEGNTATLKLEKSGALFYKPVIE